MSAEELEKLKEGLDYSFGQFSLEKRGAPVIVERPLATLYSEIMALKRRVLELERAFSRQNKKNQD